MKKLHRRTIIITLTFLLVFASVFCCCLNVASFAEAADIKPDHSDNHCYSQQSERSSSSTDTQDCECHYSNAILSNIIFDFFKPDVSFAQSFQEIFLLNVSISSLSKDSSSLLLKHSPQIVYKRNVPLYLENSIFRI